MVVDPESSLYRKYIEFSKLLNIYLNHFPKHEKYALCNRIRCVSLEMYELIVEGEKRYLKKSTLTNLDVTHEKLRMLVHLGYELGYFQFKDGSDSKDPKLEMHRYLAISRLVDELGKMIGSWIKKVKTEKNNWM